MTASHILTDLRALALHRARASAADLFLQRAAADDVEDRLNSVNRTFTSPAIVTPFPSIWHSRLPGARIVPERDVLDLQPGSHDLVVHSLGLHWSNDPVGQLIQCRNALKPDGMLIALSLGGQTLQELRACLGQAEVALTDGLSPRVAPMGEIRDLGALLQRAGLALPVADSITLKAQYRDAWHLMRDLRANGETNALAHRLRQTATRRLFDQTARLYREHHPTADGQVLATFEIVALTGWAPDSSQPKPLRPGSASQRLADALSVRETPLPD